MLGTQRPPASPRDYLQGYLEYARALSSGEFSSSQALLSRLHTDHRLVRAERELHGDGFTAAVTGYIRSLGWEPVPANEGDTFGLDFAIENPGTRLYAIGIECDTPQHALPKHARSREIWRRKVLHRSIPHVHRVSSQAWYRDGEAERGKLRQAIERALATADSVIAEPLKAVQPSTVTHR